MSLFLLQATMIGCLLVRIPDIKKSVDINKAELALGLLGAPVGTLVMLPAAGMFAARLGTRNTLLVGFPSFATATLTIGLASSLPALFVGMMLMGMALAFTEIGINVHTSNIEKRHGILVMGKAHGCWALGEMAGSLAGVLFISIGAGVFLGSLVCAALVLLPAIPAVLSMPHEKVRPEPRTRRFSLPSPTLFALGVLLLGVAMAEGAALEWSALYISEIATDNAALAGYAVTVFAAFFAALRFACDWLKERLGAVTLARLSTLVALLGLGLVVAQASVAMVFVGFAFLGAGVAAGFPLAMSAAGHLPGQTTSHVAFLSFMAIVAFLTGPVMIGFLAEQTELRWGLAILFPVLLPGLFCAKALRQKGP